MGYRLYREVLAMAPRDWTPGERLVALVIADDANEETRRSWIRVEGHWHKGRWRDGICERTGLTPRGVSDALRRLSSRDYEMRVQVGTGKDGRPVFAHEGRSLDFVVPHLDERPHPDEPSKPQEATPSRGLSTSRGPVDPYKRPRGSVQEATPPRGPSPQVSSESPHNSLSHGSLLDRCREVVADLDEREFREIKKQMRAKGANPDAVIRARLKDGGLADLIEGYRERDPDEDSGTGPGTRSAYQELTQPAPPPGAKSCPECGGTHSHRCLPGSGRKTQ